MYKTISFPAFTALALMTILSIPICNTASASLMMQKQNDKPMVFDSNSDIIVHNRVLAKINGKPITVIDLMKKMDMLFYHQFPEYSGMPQARFQFLSINWRHMLQEAIDRELVLADAEELKLKISNGDIRQEMENMLGPNIIASLDKMDLTLQEATKMVESDIIMRRTMMFRVNVKAARQVTPETIHQAYIKFSQDKANELPGTWDYSFISVRHPQAERGGELAQKIYDELAVNNSETILSSDDLKSKINAIVENNKRVSVKVSEDFHHTDLELSPQYQEALKPLAVGSFSFPVEQKSRDNSIVYRIFYLKGKAKGGMPTFKEMEAKIKDKLTQTAITAETEVYLKKLRQRFGITEETTKELAPEDFQPFALR